MPKFSDRFVSAPLLLTAALALAACQPEHHAFVGYREGAFSVKALDGQPLALYVVGGRPEGIPKIEEFFVDEVDGMLEADTAQVRSAVREAGLAEPKLADFPLMDSDYRPGVPAALLKPVVEAVRAKTKAKYLVACVGWLGADAKDKRVHAWEASPLAGQVGAVKAYVVEVASGQVVALTHAVVLTQDAASDQVTIDSARLSLEKGVWEDTAKDAARKLGDLR